VPIYVTDCRVDWGWPKRTAYERGVIRTYQPEIDGGDHGLDSITAILTRASAELPTIEIQALLEYDTRGRTLLLASRGKVRAIEIRDAERRGPYRDLPYLEPDHHASVRCGDATEDARAALAAASGEDVEEHDGEIDVPLDGSRPVLSRWCR
jgi:hypothetical protein